MSIEAARILRRGEQRLVSDGAGAWRAGIGALLVALLFLRPEASALAADATSAASADEFVGLWKAKRWFGPFARGPLVIRRTGATYTADMVGRVLSVRVEKNELSFELPNGLGSFRGRLAKGEISGYWLQPGSPVDLSQSASPIQLKAEGPNRWSGHVVPGDHIFTLYMFAQKRPDGSLGTLLINPERDFGNWLGVDHLVREGKVVKLIGKRRGQKENRELASGTYDADNQVITLAFPNRGGSYDFRRDDAQSEFYPRGKQPGRYVYQAPLARDDGWPTGTLDEVNIDRAGIEKLIQVLIDAPVELASTPKVHSLLIARHGKLVLEEYFHGEHRDKPHQTRSASKSMTATLVGAAMQAGAPLKFSTPVYQIMNGGSFPADLEPRKRAMTLEHLLTMSSGIFCDDTNDEAPGNESTMLDQTEEPDYYRFYMKVPLDRVPGEKAVYCSGDPNLALGVLSRATGESPLHTFNRLIAAPMQITRYVWPLDPAGNPYGGGSTSFLPRDFMKFGQLMLNGGTWQGHRILSREFVARASAPLYHLRGRDYGYLWWGVDYPYKDRTVHAFYAGGAGGQAVIVMPELDLVITTNGANYSSVGTFYMQMEVTPRYLLPAVREAGDDKNAPVIAREDFTPKAYPPEDTGPVSPPR